MKTFCEVCTANPATLVCLADDAVMCDTCDKRCARDAGKTANRRKTEISFFPFRERRGAESRDTTGDETRGRLASRRAPSPCLAKARSTRRDRELNLAPSPRLHFIRPAPAASTPPTPWSPSTSASRSLPSPGLCATSARCVRPRIDEDQKQQDDGRLNETFARSRCAPRAVAGASHRRRVRSALKRRNVVPSICVFLLLRRHTLVGFSTRRRALGFRVSLEKRDSGRGSFFHAR